MQSLHHLLMYAVHDIDHMLRYLLSIYLAYLLILIFLTGIQPTVISLMTTYRACISSALSVYYRTLDADITWNVLPVNILTYLSYHYTNGPERRLN